MLVLDQKFLQKEMILYLTGTKNYSCIAVRVENKCRYSPNDQDACVEFTAKYAS